MKFSHKTVDGIIETRTSDRPYTHVVVGRRDIAAFRRFVASATEHKRHQAEYRYLRLCASVEPGAQYPEGGFAVSRESHERGKATIAQYPAEHAYIEAKIAERVAELGEADKGPEVVLQWSMSERAACKSISTHSTWNTDVRVLPINGGE